MLKIEEVQKIRSKMIGRVSIEETEVIIKEIKNQIKVHRESDMCIKDTELYLVGKDTGECITMKKLKGYIIREGIDNSYKKYKEIKDMCEKEIRYIILVEFTEGYKYKVREVTKQSIENIQCMKARSVYYGVTDGKTVERVLVREVDIRGVEDKDLEEMLKYTFNKRTQQEATAIQGYLVSYT